MLRVFQEKDKVIVGLDGRKQDILLGVLQAEQLENALELAANGVELEPKELLKGEVWNIRVLSFDRQVTIRIWPPEGITTDRIVLTGEAARKLAENVRFARQQASYGMRFETPTAVTELDRKKNPGKIGVYY